MNENLFFMINWYRTKVDKIIFLQSPALETLYNNGMKVRSSERVASDRMNAATPSSFSNASTPQLFQRPKQDLIIIWT